MPVLYLISVWLPARKAGELGPCVHRYMVERTSSRKLGLRRKRPQTLENLQNAGFTLGLVFQPHQPRQASWRSWAWSRFFNLALVAGEVKSWKPEPKIFLTCIGSAGRIPMRRRFTLAIIIMPISLEPEAVGIQPVLIDPEGIFPDAECPVITRLDEISQVIDALGKAETAT